MTANNIYAVVSGKAHVTAEGGFDATLGVGDVAAMPSWHAHAIEAPEDAVGPLLFLLSDQATMTASIISRDFAFTAQER